MSLWLLLMGGVGESPTYIKGRLIKGGVLRSRGCNIS